MSLFVDVVVIACLLLSFFLSPFSLSSVSSFVGVGRRRRREDRTTAQLILENSNRGKSVATTTLSGLQTGQQPHLHIQISKINSMNMCSQFTYLTCARFRLFRDYLCFLSCTMRCMCVLIVNRCRACSGNRQ